VLNRYSHCYQGDGSRHDVRREFTQAHQKFIAGLAERYITALGKLRELMYDAVTSIQPVQKGRIETG
jgi:hypothetical protein